MIGTSLLLLLHTAIAGGPAITETPVTGVGLSVGVAGASGGGWLRDDLGLFATSTRTGGFNLQAFGRWQLVRAAGGFQIELRMGGGLLTSVRVPTIGVSMTPVLSIGHVTERFTGGLSVSAPATVAWADRRLATELPVIGGLHLGGHLKHDLWLVASFRMGAAWRDGDVPGPAIVFDPGVSLIWRLPGPASPPPPHAPED